MERIQLQRKYLKPNQKPDRISGNVSTFLKILRSANNPGLKAKLEGNDQLILKGSVIFESKYIYYFLETDGSIWMDLIAFSTSIFSSFSIS